MHRLLRLSPSHRLALAWLWLALLWGVGTQLPKLAPWTWLAALLALAALPAWGLWLALMIRKRVLYLQFARTGWLPRWFSGGLWPAAKAVLAALALVAAALWQAYFLASAEWLLLALAPLLYAVLLRILDQALARQFSQPAFAWAAAQRAARWLLTLALGAIWLAFMLHGALDQRVANPSMPAETLDQAVDHIAAARSGLVRWGLDGLLAVQVLSSAVRDLPQSRQLRLLLLALCGPGVMLLTIAYTLQGLSGLRRSLRHAARLQPVGSARARSALAAFIAVLALAILLSGVAALESRARQHASPLALQRLPPCEQIAGHYYTLGTTDKLRQVALQALGQARASPEFCERSGDMAQALDAALERYLDWYFSLGAEWGRILHLLAGNGEAFLQQRLEQTLQQTPGLAPWLQALAEREDRASALLSSGQQRVHETLQAHRLVLDSGRCLVQAELDAPAALPELDRLAQRRQHLVARTSTGLGAGAFAGTLAAKAVSKAGMKAASKMLAKAAAKQGLGKAGTVAAGAALGSVVPGAGTAAGVLAGAAVGALVSGGMDWTALRLEEHLTRDDMKAELRAALDEHMSGLSDGLGCNDGLPADPDQAGVPENRS